MSQGDYAEARRRWDQALALVQDEDGPDARHTEAFVLAKVLAAQEGEAERVVRLLAGAAAIRAVAAGEAAGGRAMTFDQVLDHAAAWADQQRKGAT